MATANPPQIIKISPNDPQATAALDAEQRLFDHYGLQAQTHYIDLKQTPIRLRVLEFGSGQPLVIVPGGEGAGFQWAALIAQLKGHRIILINRPGAALSDYVDHRQVPLRQLAVDTISSVMDAFDLQNAPIMCHSMGGLWSMWFTLAQPDRVSRMVQLGCPASILDTNPPFFMRLMTIPGVSPIMSRLLAPKDIDSALNSLRAMGSTETAIQAHPRELKEAVYYFAQLPTFRPARETLLQSVVTLAGAKDQLRLDENELKQIMQPVLFIWGDNDPFGGLDVARQVVTIMPNAQLREVSSGHQPYLDVPEACGKFIGAFLGE